MTLLFLLQCVVTGTWHLSDAGAHANAWYLQGIHHGNVADNLLIDLQHINQQILKGLENFI